ncbi:MAG: Arc family DNA-binding protein [Duncaniella sp.]|nr:Arc family DNA-binding protein [Duncaniella sp.]
MAAKVPSKGFLLRLDPEAMEMVERWAEQEFRSVNGQIQWIINDALNRYKRKPVKGKS